MGLWMKRRCHPYLDGGGVHFLFYDERAQQVSVIADFNGWDPEKAIMQTTTKGRWSLTLPTPPPGLHHYKFLIDNDRWVDDPENSDKEPDGYGGFNAVLRVS